MQEQKNFAFLDESDEVDEVVNVFTSLMNEGLLYYIYAIYHAETRSVYVDFIETTSVETKYREHFLLKHPCTKTLFKLSKEKYEPPKMYLLAIFFSKPPLAYTEQLTWIDYFQNQGLTCLNTSAEKRDAKNIWGKCCTDKAALAKKQLTDLFNAEKEVTPTILKEHKNRSKKIGITKTSFECPDESHEIIKMNAKNNKMTMGTYLESVGTFGCVIHVDYDCVREHTKKITEFHNDILHLIQLYSEDDHEISEKDFQFIKDTLKELNDSEKTFLDQFLKENSSRKKKLLKAIYNKQHCKPAKKFSPKFKKATILTKGASENDL